jgi:hypothetical protein
MTTLFMYLLMALIGKFTLTAVAHDCDNFRPDR